MYMDADVSALVSPSFLVIKRHISNVPLVVEIMSA